MNKTILNFTFYLCISFFAFHCGAPETPEIPTPQEKNTTEAEDYIENFQVIDNKRILITVKNNNKLFILGITKQKKTLFRSILHTVMIFDHFFVKVPLLVLYLRAKYAFSKK